MFSLELNNSVISSEKQDKIEDSGIDSDARHSTDMTDTQDNFTVVPDNPVHVGDANCSPAKIVAEQNYEANPVQSQPSYSSIDLSGKSTMIGPRASTLQKQIENQREVQQAPGKKSLPSRSRLVVPVKGESAVEASDVHPLVAIESESEEDEFEVMTMSREAHRQITQQLIKDGYNLDLEPDDEDLDLIPPRPLSERWGCCKPGHSSYCSVQ